MNLVLQCAVWASIQHENHKLSCKSSWELPEADAHFGAMGSLQPGSLNLVDICALIQLPNGMQEERQSAQAIRPEWETITQPSRQPPTARPHAHKGCSPQAAVRPAQGWASDEWARGGAAQGGGGCGVP